MFFLHTLLFFLFGTAVVEARHQSKAPINTRPPDNPDFRQPVPPHIPPASYGYWVRWDIENVSKSLLLNRICMYLTCHIASTR